MEGNTDVIEREPTASEDRSADIGAALDQHIAADTPGTKAVPETKEPGAGAPDAAAGRDAIGRFAPKRTGAAPADGTAAPADGTAPAPKADAAGAAGLPDAASAGDAAAPVKHAKAPASWKAEEAAHWDKTTPEVREAIMRREIETNRALQDSASARQGLQTLQGAIAPYIPNVNAANGGDVVGAIKTFFDYDNRMRHGTQIEKAQAVSRLIRGYGIDIATLDNELAGAAHDPQQVNQTAIQAEIAKGLAPLREFMSQRERDEAATRAHTIETVDQAISNFATDPKHLHYQSVREDMADIMELAAHRGRPVTLEQAYETACWQNPKIRSMLLTVQTGANGRAQSDAAQRAKAAAVGVKNAPRAGAPAVKSTPDKRSRADDIAAAFDTHASATE